MINQEEQIFLWKRVLKYTSIYLDTLSDNKVMESECVWRRRGDLRTSHYFTLTSQISVHVYKGSYNTVLSSWSKLHQNY